MEFKIKVGLTAFVVGVILASIFVRETKTSSKFASTETYATETGRYIVYNESGLIGDSSKAQVFSIPGAEKLEGLNAYVIDRDPTKTRFMSALPAGWRIQKEYIHHVFMGQAKATCYKTTSVLSEIPCPSDDGTPQPSPGPGPTPEPEPEPVPPPPQSKSWGVTRVHAEEAQRLVDTSAVKVCVIDTGIDLQHPQRGNIVGTRDFTGKGTVQDGQGHGTHTAGTISGSGGVGVSRSALYICKGLDDRGAGSSQALAQCLGWCGAQGAQIVSNSWGSPQSDPLINQAINQLTAKGIYVIVAAGNDSGPVNWPAKLAGSNPLVYAIAASDQGDRITSFSSRGPEIRFIAPGAGIVSNWPGGGTKSLDGTSMATPHVAGICAFGISKGRRPCVGSSGTISGYPVADALETVK